MNLNLAVILQNYKSLLNSQGQCLLTVQTYFQSKNLNSKSIICKTNTNCDDYDVESDFDIELTDFSIMFCE